MLSSTIMFFRFEKCSISNSIYMPYTVWVLITSWLYTAIIINQIMRENTAHDLYNRTYTRTDTQTHILYTHIQYIQYNVNIYETRPFPAHISPGSGVRQSPLESQHLSHHIPRLHKQRECINFLLLRITFAEKCKQCLRCTLHRSVLILFCGVFFILIRTDNSIPQKIFSCRLCNILEDLSYILTPRL